MNTERIFTEQRRQPFITEGYYEAKLNDIKFGLTVHTDALLNGYVNIQGQRFPITREARLEALANEHLDLLILHYTAGEAIEGLRQELEGVVAAWEDVAKEAGVIAEPPKGSCFGFAWRTDYQKFIGMVGLAVLLHRDDLLPRMDTLVPGFKESDAVYEEIIKPFIKGRKYTETWYHDMPYEDAVNGLDAFDRPEKSALMKTAVESWYAAHEGVPFHDSHKDVSDEGGGGYVGYWCFELAALCYLHNIDDSPFRDALVYPKDLVEWARGYQAPQPEQPQLPSAAPGLRAMPGEVCPKAGRWMTQALLNLRTITLNAGERFPSHATDKSGNAVIWYFMGEA